LKPNPLALAHPLAPGAGARETVSVTPDWVKLGLVSAEALASAAQHQRARGISLEGALIDLALLTERAVLEILSRPFGGHAMTADQLEHLSISPDLLRLVPQATSIRLRALPFDQDARGRLWVLCSAPLDGDPLRQLQSFTRASSVQGVAAIPEAIERASRRAYLRLEAGTDGSGSELSLSSLSAERTIPDEQKDSSRKRSSPLIARPVVADTAAPTEPSRDPPGAPPALTVVESLRLGSVLERRWRLDAELGRGGAGTVFRAFDLTGQRGAAVKVLLPSLARNPVAVARFEREARILSTVSHPNLVALYAVGRSGALPYIAMELLMGQPLSARLKDESVRLSTAEVLRIVDAVASALEALHSRGLVHRDVKPANVFLGPGGRVTLLDLGAVFERADPGLTRPNHWIGTPAYMAPEQLLSGTVDARTDVYALAALAFELLVGFPPFKASDPDALSLAQRSLPPPDASQLSPAVSRVAGRVLMAALARNPQDRFPTPGTFTAALREGLTGLSSTQHDDLSSESTEAGRPRSDVPTPRVTQEDLPWRKR